MKNFIATILGAIFWPLVNLYFYLLHQDFYPCPFEVVRDTWAVWFEEKGWS